MKKKIAIVGASYLQLPLVETANRLGLETHCFAWEEGAVCKEKSDFFYPISVLDKEAILKICEDVKVDGITTIATDIAVPTISYVAENLNLIGNTYASSIIATNKALMRETFRTAYLSSPRFMVTNNDEELEKINLDYPVIVKPVDRSGSRGINLVHGPKEIKSALEVALKESLSNSAVIEEFIVGDEVSVESISWKGEHFILSITDKVTTGPPHFVELAHHQPSQQPQNILEEITSLTKKALTSLGIEYGAGHTEIKINKNNELFIIEVGARMGGDFIGSHLVPLSTGYDFLEGVLKVALNDFYVPLENDVHFNTMAYSGIYFLSKETEKILKYFSTSNSFDVKKEIQAEGLKFVNNSNDRSGFLIYKSEERIQLL